MPSYDITKRAAKHSPQAFALLLAAREIRRANRSMTLLRDECAAKIAEYIWYDERVTALAKIAAEVDSKRRNHMRKAVPG